MTLACTACSRSSCPKVCGNCHESVAARHGLEQLTLQHCSNSAAESAFLEVVEMSSAHILAVDDDPCMCEMISDYLAGYEIRVTALPSARQITDVMARETIDRTRARR